MSACLASNLEPESKIAKPTSTVSVLPKENSENNDQENKLAIVSTNPDKRQKDNQILSDNLQNVDWLELDIDNDSINDKNLAEILDNLERQDAYMVPIHTNAPTTTNTINVSKIQRLPQIPGMYFPNSTQVKCKRKHVKS